MSPSRNESSAQTGLTLLELLLSMLLGLFLSAGIVSLYLHSKRAYQADEALARIQEHGRFALNLLGRELSMAGFFAGVPAVEDLAAPALSPDCATDNWAMGSATPLDFLDDHDSAALTLLSGTTLTCIAASQVRAGSDVLVVKRTASEASLSRGGYGSGFSASSTQRWFLRISDDGAGLAWERLAPAELGDAGDPNDPGFSLAYWERYTRVFYLRDYSDPSHPGDGIPTLCEEGLSGEGMTTRCLVEGIEDLQIEFGIDTDADGVANQYRSPADLAELERAVTARIFLLVRSIDELPRLAPGAGRTYFLGRKRVTRSDGYLRRVFSTTVEIKNARHRAS